MSNPTLVHGKRQSLGKTIWKHRASYLLMAPYFILFFFFTVLPVLMAIGVSFTDWNMLEKPEFVGWQTTSSSCWMTKSSSFRSKTR